MNLKLYGYGLGVIGLIASLWYAHDSGYDTGYNEKSVECQATLNELQAERDKLIESAKQVGRELTKKAEEAEAARIEAESKREVVYETIEKEVVRYVETNSNSRCIVDDDFLRIWRAANANLSQAE